ncbi:MAG: hypothetical protein DYG93_00140 [Leptolyngbya sp. PLA2]|nr:hypothetical protein [Leptolyngbya sp. PL-A2]MCQ3940196.1 hypothetical protein [cyanobacterium CYA1]GIK20181.1 MAG: hypothetical protein BroJett004_23450 [Planctomycetota bacterium]
MELHSSIRGFLLSQAASGGGDRPVDAAAIAGAINRPRETVIRALRVMRDELGEVTYTPATDGGFGLPRRPADGEGTAAVVPRRDARMTFAAADAAEG